MRVLVTVASRHGSTREIGSLVAQWLGAAGHDVDEIEPDEVATVEPYDAVVLGSAVYVGRLSAALRELVDRQAGQLAARPVWLFWSGPVGNQPVPTEAASPDDVRSIAQRLEVRDVKCFPGRLDRSELGIAERALVAMIDAEQGDFRDLEEIQEWAASIADALLRTVRRQRRPV